MPDLAAIIDDDAARVARAVDLSPLDGSSVLITGASGLLGISLIACMRQRMRITGRPIHVTAVTRAAPPAAFAGLFDMPYLRLCRVDLADPPSLRKLPAADHVIHAAGYGQPQKFLLDPGKTIRINTEATLTLLEQMPARGKFLFLSSSEVYSGSPRTPHRENDIGTTDPGHVRACYIEGKRCGEAICHAVRAGGREVKAARLALAYGPGTRSDDQRVLNILIRRALLEGRVSLLDQGAARRSYGYISDVAELLLWVLLYGREALYNVGGRSSVTILELARIIADIVGVPVHVPAQAREVAGAPDDVALDLSRACEEFGKTGFVSLREGLSRTIAWQRELYADILRHSTGADSREGRRAAGG